MSDFLGELKQIEKGLVSGAGTGNFLALQEAIGLLGASDPDRYVDEISILDNIIREISRETAEAFDRRRDHYNALNEVNQETSFIKLWVGEGGLVEEAKGILVQNASAAAGRTHIYSESMFVDHLAKSLMQEGIISASYNEVEGATVSIKDGLYELCGTLEDYASAVKAGRQLISNTLKGEEATFVWFNFLYRPAVEGITLYYITSGGKREERKAYTEDMVGLYWAIMFARLQDMVYKAPYWNIIEDGNIGSGENPFKLSTDKGGSPAPTQGPQRFVKSSEAKISALINSAVKKDASDMVEAYQRGMRAEEKFISNTTQVGEIARSFRDFYANRQREEFVETETIVNRWFESPETINVQQDLNRLQSKDRISQATERATLSKLDNKLKTATKESTISDNMLARMSLRKNIFIQNILVGNIPEKSRVHLGVTKEGKKVRVRTTELIRETRDLFAGKKQTPELIKERKKFISTLKNDLSVLTGRIL